MDEAADVSGQGRNDRDPTAAAGDGTAEVREGVEPPGETKGVRYRPGPDEPTAPGEGLTEDERFLETQLIEEIKADPY
ncbi:MAG: hypothetical protein PVI57_20435, partial [Gemmatimonadota bacterium]